MTCKSVNPSEVWPTANYLHTGKMRMIKELTKEAEQIIRNNLALSKKESLPIFEWLQEQNSLKAEFFKLGSNEDEFYFYSQLIGNNLLKL